MESDKETLQKRLKYLKEILDFQQELGEDTSSVEEKIYELEKLINQSN